MSKFKVGDEVVLIHLDKKGIVVKYHPDYNSSPYRVYVPDYDDTCLVSEIALQLLNPAQTVYAVCDDSNGLLPVRVFMFEDNAREYARLNSPQGYSIRPFALIPINE